MKKVLAAVCALSVVFSASELFADNIDAVSEDSL